MFRKTTAQRKPDQLTNFQNILRDSMFDFLDTIDILNLGQVNKAYQRTVKSYFNPTIFYAVGNPMPIYVFKQSTYHNCDRWGSESQVTSYHAERDVADVKATFHSTSVVLFNKLRDAESYAYFTQERAYDTNIHYHDRPFKVKSTAAIFVVMALRSDKYKLKKHGENVTEHIPPCGRLIKAESMTFEGFTTCRGNVKPLLANFNGKFFDLQADSRDLREIWHAASRLDAKATPHQAALGGVNATLNQYLTWYACITRHHIKDVQNILEVANKRKTLKGLYNYIKKQHERAKRNSYVNPKGDFMRLLNFTREQLELALHFAKMEDLPRFYNLPRSWV